MTAKLICSWCALVMRDGSEPASHGICPECLKGQLEVVSRSKRVAAIRDVEVQ